MPTPIVPTPISTMPDAPTPNDPINFEPEADAFVAALPLFRSETNAISDVNYDNSVIAHDAATSALVSEQNAAASATAAATSANAERWVSGTNYLIDVCVISPLDSQTYRRKIPGAGAIDPKNDKTNWTPISFSRGKLHAIALYF